MKLEESRADTAFYILQAFSASVVQVYCMVPMKVMNCTELNNTMFVSQALGNLSLNKPGSGTIGNLSHIEELFGSTNHYSSVSSHYVALKRKEELPFASRRGSHKSAPSLLKFTSGSDMWERRKCGHCSCQGSAADS